MFTWGLEAGSHTNAAIVEVFMWPRASARTYCADSRDIPPHEGFLRNQP